MCRFVQRWLLWQWRERVASVGHLCWSAHRLRLSSSDVVLPCRPLHWYPTLFSLFLIFLFSDVCSAGYFCGNGSTSATQHICPAGVWGSAGMSSPKCAGTSFVACHCSLFLCYFHFDISQVRAPQGSLVLRVKRRLLARGPVLVSIVLCFVFDVLFSSWILLPADVKFLDAVPVSCGFALFLCCVQSEWPCVQVALALVVAQTAAVLACARVCPFFVVSLADFCCTANYYCPSASWRATMFPCPANAVSPAGSTSVGQCKCLWGFQGPAQGPCVG